MSEALDPDRYRSLADGPEVERRVLGSRFLGRAFAAADEDAARAAIARVRRKYHDATHHGSAWRIGSPEGVVERFDDDGEPAGTTGRPILAALQGRRVHDAVVVVTRWFGGTKLGTGGLARAYGEAAAAAIDAAPVVERVLTGRIAVACAFDDLGAVEAVLARAGDAVLAVERSYEPSPRLAIDVPRGRVRALAAELVDATAGRARVESGP